MNIKNIIKKIFDFIIKEDDIDIEAYMSFIKRLLLKIKAKDEAIESITIRDLNLHEFYINDEIYILSDYYRISQDKHRETDGSFMYDIELFLAKKDADSYKWHRIICKLSEEDKVWAENNKIGKQPYELNNCEAIMAWRLISNNRDVFSVNIDFDPNRDKEEKLKFFINGKQYTPICCVWDRFDEHEGTFYTKTCDKEGWPLNLQGNCIFVQRGYNSESDRFFIGPYNDAQDDKIKEIRERWGIFVYSMIFEACENQPSIRPKDYCDVSGRSLITKICEQCGRLYSVAPAFISDDRCYKCRMEAENPSKTTVKNVTVNSHYSIF